MAIYTCRLDPQTNSQLVGERKRTQPTTSWTAPVGHEDFPRVRSPQSQVQFHASPLSENEVRSTCEGLHLEEIHLHYRYTNFGGYSPALTWCISPQANKSDLLTSRNHIYVLFQYSSTPGSTTLHDTLAMELSAWLEEPTRINSTRDALRAIVGSDRPLL